jgi:hypothetical protein
MPPWVRSYCITDFSTAERRAFLAAEISGRTAVPGVCASSSTASAIFCPTSATPKATSWCSNCALAIRYETVLLLVLHENPNECKDARAPRLATRTQAESNIGSQRRRRDHGNLYRKAGTLIFRASPLLQMGRRKGNACLARKGAPLGTGDLVEAIFDCEPARKQAGGYGGRVFNRFVELNLYKSRRRSPPVRNSRRRLAHKAGEFYWPPAREGTFVP